MGKQLARWTVALWQRVEKTMGTKLGVWWHSARLTLVWCVPSPTHTAGARRSTVFASALPLPLHLSVEKVNSMPQRVLGKDSTPGQKSQPFVAPATAPAPPLESQNWQTASLTQSGFWQQPWLQKQTKSSPCSAFVPTLLCVSKEKVSLKVRVGLAGGSWLSGSHRLWSAPQCFPDRDQTHKVKLLFPTLCSVGSKAATVGVFGHHPHCKQQ